MPSKYGKIPYNCLACHKVFYPTNQQLKKGNGKYCSISCYHIYSKERSRSPERFWKWVDKRGDTECWPWLGARMLRGYGQLFINNEMLMAHRLAWEWTYGPLEFWQWIKHTCTLLSCCNPNHLYMHIPRKFQKYVITEFTIENAVELPEFTIDNSVKFLYCK